MHTSEDLFLPDKKISSLISLCTFKRYTLTEIAKQINAPTSTINNTLERLKTQDFIMMDRIIRQEDLLIDNITQNEKQKESYTAKYVSPFLYPKNTPKKAHLHTWSKEQTEQLITFFNSEEYSIPELAIAMNRLESTIKSKIKSLQDRGILGKKNKVGKIVTKPIKKGEKRTQAPIPEEKSKMGLEDFLSAAEAVQIDTETISVKHREMLIEILHKVIL